jgi:AbrB family looped-hinge helix DNA binding protein
VDGITEIRYYLGMGKYTNLTVKGQVTIPKDVRDALGLKPGDAVEFDWNANGEAIIRKPVAEPAEAFEMTLRRFRENAKRFAQMFPQGIDSVEYVRDMRGGDDPALS